MAQKERENVKKRARIRQKRIMIAKRYGRGREKRGRKRIQQKDIEMGRNSECAKETETIGYKQTEWNCQFK